MAVTLITPHQRPNSGGVYAIQQFARYAATRTEVHVVVAKGDPVPIEGVHVHGPRTLERLELPEADALVIPADMRRGERLFGLPPEHGAPMLLFQGYGILDDPVVHANLILASHVLCTSSWLVDQAAAAGCTARLVRYGLDREIFVPGPAAKDRGPVVAMMTHPLDWKGTEDGLKALEFARERMPELQVQLFGKADPGVKWASFLPAPNKLTEVAALMREAAVFVCSSWEEGFGLPGLEAIASGAALATTDTKGSRDYAFHGRTALVSRPRYPMALGRNIVKLVRDPKLRTRLSAEGKRHIDAIYTDWDAAAAAFLAAVGDGVAAIRRSSAHRAAPGQVTDAPLDEGVATEQPPAAGRTLRRVKLLLQESEAERAELEAELEQRAQHLAEAKRRLRGLQAELERERDQREEAGAAREASETRAKRHQQRLAKAEEKLARLESDAQAAVANFETEREALQAQSKARLAEVQLESDTKLAQERSAFEAKLLQERSAFEANLAEQRSELEAKAAGVRSELEAKLAEKQTEARRAAQASIQARDELARHRDELARVRDELARLSTELEVTASQRRRLQASLARARADAQIAEAERAALDAQLTLMTDRLADSEPEFAASEEAFRSLALLPDAAARWPELPPGERQTQQALRSAYADLTADLPPAADERDPLALPIPADMHRLLAASAEDQADEPASVDVIVCVHNALEDTRLCLWSLLHKATRPFRLIVVNDGSDEPTTAFLDRVATDHPVVTLIHRVDPPHGYTVAANHGMRESTSDYVVLLNSDTIVSYGWLERIVDYGQRHEQVGILGPLSNAATHQSVPARRSKGQWAANPLPAWLTPDGVALVLERAAPRPEVRLPFINGFCYVVKRSVISAIGYFDEETFPGGYAEENDYSQRAREAGFDLGVVSDAYVYHAKSRSYLDNGRTIARAAYQAFLDKHGKDNIEVLVKQMESDTALEPVRLAVSEALASPEASASAVEVNGDGRLSVAFVLPGLSEGGSGGSHSIYQEVHGLRRLGVAATIGLHERAWERACTTYEDAHEMFQPYSDADSLAELTADANVIVATHFKSVETLSALCRQRDDFLPAYYVQDYEPFFKFADDADNLEAAASYTTIDRALLFAKTHWLCNVIARRHGAFVAKVEPSLDETLYYPAPSREQHGPVRIAAMLRPRTPRRQPYSTVAVLERLLDRSPSEVEVHTFGCPEADLERLKVSPQLRAAHRGVLKRDEVAELMRETDIFLDASTYQAFGRTAIEAMACGATAVVPRIGGIWEFAQHGENTLAVDTMDLDATFSAVASLIEDRDRLDELKSAAQATASRYSILRAALSEYVVLRHAYQVRFG